MMKKTIYELAKELNLAPSTISKALNNNPGISEEKRKMIVVEIDITRMRIQSKLPGLPLNP